MTFKLNTADLQFVLRQIKIAEANSTAHNGVDAVDLRAVYVDPQGNTMDSAGVAYSPASHPAVALTLAIPDPHVPAGLRTVDGTYNNIVPGRELWGASGQPMPQAFDPRYLNENDGETFDANGPTQPGGVVSNTNYGQPGSVVDSDPRTISNLVVDQSLDNPAAIAAALKFVGSENIIVDQREITASHEALKAAQLADPTGDHSALQTELDTLLAEKGLTVTNGSLDILNIAPDEGLSAPFNAWMTFFGQFFDHGLDLISKGGNGTVYIPLANDDPLVTHGPDGILANGDEVTARNQFMVLTRATPVGDGQDQQRNVTTPFVDQNQTYTSNASHQVFLREYELVDGRPVATGRLLGSEGGGLATWADVKAQAREVLGINLTDADVSAVPQLLVDVYGEFVRGANGLPQVMIGVTTEGQAIYTEGSLTAPIDLTSVGAARTFNAFIDDIAHNAAPVFANGVLQPDANTGDMNADTGNAQPVGPSGRNQTYDDELLDRHFVTGDGRGNENIGLMTVHHIFHSEHNRQVEAQKLAILQSANLAFINEWLAVDVAALPVNFAQMTTGELQVYASELTWDGERLFQAGRFATEMQYQHLVFEEFARKIQPMIDPFVFNAVADIDPAIFAEFANTVYRFGHSMLTENMPRLDADGQPMDTDLGLIEAFLNPVRFDNNGAISHDEGAAAIIRGMTIERGSEIDEFVVGALRNNLLGLPLDLAAINLARGRDTGTPSLNEARQQLYAATGSTFLTPYTSWAEMAANLKNPLSIVNLVAAYGTHETVTTATTLEAKRDAAMALVFGGAGTPEDRLDFLNHRGDWAARETGFNAVDLWIGGLAEKQMPFGGMLGSTFNAIFEAQMENLQDADRFYYLTRVQGQNFLNELEQNSFSKLMLANTSLSQPGPDGIRGTEDDIVPRHIGVDSFADYDFELEVNAANQLDQNGAAPGVDPTGNDPVLEALGIAKVMRDDPGTTAVEQNYLRFTGGEHVLVGGTNGNDTIITDFGDDAIWGDAGNDRIESGAGVDLVNGGAGDDIITDSGDTGDFLKGEDGNDVIANSNGIDILMGGRGKDAIFVGVDSTEVFAGEGDDFILGGADVDLLMGNEGDDWIEGGGGFDTTAGDNSELFFNSAILGHDVMFAGSDEHDFDAESGDDIMVQGESVMRNEGMFGFDWTIFKGMALDGYADMRIPIFTTEQEDILRNRFDKVEALSGWKHNDTLIGDSRVATTAADPEEPIGNTVGTTEGEFFGDGLNQAGVERITGLRTLLGNLITAAPEGATVAQLEAAFAFDKGNILLGGGGNDRLQGNGGDDVLDGDAWLNVRISIRDSAGIELASLDSLKHIFDNSLQNVERGWAGRSLFELLVDRVVTPVQLNIVREILTEGVSSNDIDTAVFNDVRANYAITRAANGHLTVAHLTQSDPAVDDGTDTVRNVEKLQFADGTIDVALVLDQPFDRLNIVPVDVDLGVFGAQFTVGGSTVTEPPAGVTSLQWQVFEIGQWRNVVPGQDGTLSRAESDNRGFGQFAPNASLAGAELRVVANWNGSTFIEQQTASVETGIGGTATEEDLSGTTVANVILGLAGDDDIEGDLGNDLIDGGLGDDRIDGGDGDDILHGNAGADILIGRTGNNKLNGGEGDDELSGGHGNDELDGGAGLLDTAVYSGPIAAYNFERNGEGAIVVSDSLGAEGDGVDKLTAIEQIQMGEGTLYTLGGIGTARSDIVVGTAADDDLSGAQSDDLIFAGAGSDAIAWQVGDGRDIVNGGTEGAAGDTFVINGNADTEIYRIYTRAAFDNVTGSTLNGISADTEIIITRNGTDSASIIAELREIEEIRINGIDPAAPSGSAGADTFEIVGDFSASSLRPNTITIDGNAGDDTVDISALTSAHRIVFKSNGGNDTIVGNLRPQDVIELAPGKTLDDYEAVENANGTTTLSSGSHSVTFFSTSTPTFQTGLAPPTAPGDTTGTPGGGTVDDEDDGTTEQPGDGHSNPIPGTGDGDEDEDEDGAPTTGGGADNDDEYEDEDEDEDDEDVDLPPTGGSGDDEDEDEDDEDVDLPPTGGSGDNDDDEDEDEGTSPTPSPGSGTPTAPRVGTVNADVLVGSALAEDFVAFAGDDVITAGDGDDTVSAGEGADFIRAGAGRDMVFGGSGDDQVFAEDGADMVYGEAGSDRVFAGAGNDLVDAGSGDDTVFGGAGNDLFLASIGDGNDTYYGDDQDGGAGVDTLDMSAILANAMVDLGTGSRGSATSAQSGTDILWSIENVITGAGNDTITAGVGVNVLDGGDGNDTFRFESVVAVNGDRILGFEPGDKIDLSGIDANYGSAGDQAFTIATGTALTAAGQLTITYETTPNGEITVVKGNVDATTDADFRLEIQGHHTLTNQNFGL